MFHKKLIFLLVFRNSLTNDGERNQYEFWYSLCTEAQISDTDNNNTFFSMFVFIHVTACLTKDIPIIVIVFGLLSVDDAFGEKHKSFIWK